MCQREGKADDGQACLKTLEKQPVPGFLTRFDDWEQPDFDPLSRVTFTSPAFTVESDPIRSISELFQGMSTLVPEDEEFGSFLADLCWILTREDVPLNVERLLMVADNIRGLHTKIAEGELDFGRHRDKILHDLDLAYRLAYLAGGDMVG